MEIRTESRPTLFQTDIFRLDPQFRFKTRSDIVVRVCGQRQPAGRPTRESWASISSPVLMTACLLSSGPLGCCPFPSQLCALIGHKCSCLMLLSCLVSSDAECDVGVVTGIWNGYNEIIHLGRCIVSCLEYHVRVRHICSKSPFLLSWEEPRLA